MGRPRKEKEVETFNDGSDGMQEQDTEVKLTIAEQLAAARKELEGLRGRISGAGLKVPRKIPESYLFTMNSDIVERLQMEDPHPSTKHRKLRKNAIAPFHVTGCSLGDGKMFYFDAEKKRSIAKILTEKEMEELKEVTEVKPSEHLALDELTEKMSESKDKKKEILAARGVEQSVVREIVAEE